MSQQWFKNMTDMRDWITEKIDQIRERQEGINTTLIFCGVVCTIILMYYRAFFGTELTDEAYYISEAKEMLNGNIPFAYNNSSKALGFAFLLIPIEAVYRLLVPDLAGIVLFTRLCFVTYKIIIWHIVYKVFQRKEKRSHALLLSALLLPISGYMPNFNYNTIPQLTMFLAGSLLYDVIEQDAPRKKGKLIVAGFMTGIACFANPGWAVALIVFTILILFRVSKNRERIRMLAFFLGAVFAEVIIIVVPISIQTSFSAFWYGFYRLFIHPIPMDPLNPGKTWIDVIGSFKDPFKQWIEIFMLVLMVLFIFSFIYIPRNKGRALKKQCLTFSVAAAMFIHLMHLCYTARGSTDLVYLWAFVAFCYMVVFALTGMYREEKIIWYLGIYPPVYAMAEIMLLSNGATIGRFVNVYTIMIPMLFVLIKDRSKIVRILSIVIAAVVIVSFGYIDFHYVYRDADFPSLKYKVLSGVYKGLYTTQTRARDLPELEEYLNNILDEDETYAFRDNVPSAYLMVKRGNICEISTWDILQYSYHRNSPAVLFDYYRRRDMIPDKIIYIDFGRDENLSIDTPEYRYNDWINEYYDLIEDVKLNETYFRILVYQYNGTFDGDYQYWIDAYW
jgi:hypothetical protein